jgi:transcriptional regulator with XRE-family HTH domain
MFTISDNVVQYVRYNEYIIGRDFGKMSLGDNIKRLRRANNISTRDLAAKTGVSKTTINEIERNIVTNPTLETLQKIADALSVPIGLLTSKEDTIVELSKDLYSIAEFNNLDDLSDTNKRDMIIDLLKQEPELFYEITKEKYIGPLTIDEYAALKTYLKLYREGKSEVV